MLLFHHFNNAECIPPARFYYISALPIASWHCCRARCCQGQNSPMKENLGHYYSIQMSIEVIWTRGASILLSHIPAARDKTNRSPSMRWKHGSHTSNAPASSSPGVIPLRQTKWHSWQRKEQSAKQARVLNDPRCSTTLVTGEGQH